MKRDSGEDSPSERIENKEDYSAEPSGSDLGADHGFTLEEQKRIMWRLDRRLVPVLGVMYCVSLMDRTNLGAASIAGMTTDLMLIGDRYVSWPDHSPSSLLGWAASSPVASFQHSH